ncbi:MAG: hypothetical protein G8237_10290 [Magnetococcales bacterium]|nr:substrate-binding domain-containing protein [Magnetococcales bacterium]NGZ06734.1 hypothetical protein [Magnetococcales bacterium]
MPASRRIFWIWMVLVWLMSASRVDAESIRVNGTGAMLSAIQQIVERHYQNQSEIRFDFRFPPIGSSGAIKALTLKQLDLALTGRPLKPEEQDAGLIQIALGHSPFVFVVHQGAAVSHTTMQEMTEIYAGRQKNWAEGGRIRVILRPVADADTAILTAISPAMKEALTLAHANRQPGSGLAETDIDLVDLVEKVPGGVGSVALTLILAEKRRLKPLHLDGVEPTVKAMEENRYPLIKPAFLIMRTDASATVRGIADYLGTPEGQAALHALGISNRTR